jgi:hypothetical protein
MVKEIRIYIEGGGDDRDTKRQIRQGFSGFLKDLVQIGAEQANQMGYHCLWFS